MQKSEVGGDGLFVFGRLCLWIEGPAEIKIKRRSGSGRDGLICVRFW